MSAYRGYRMAADLHKALGNATKTDELDALADATAEEAKQYENDGEMRGNMGR